MVAKVELGRGKVAEMRDAGLAETSGAADMGDGKPVDSGKILPVVWTLPNC